MAIDQYRERIVVTLVSDDFHAAETLAEHRWPSGFECRRCEGRKAVHLRCRPRVWECSSCGCHNSVTAGTALHRTRLPLGHVLLASVLMARPESISANRLRQIIGCRYETAWSLLHRLRYALEQQPAAAGEVRAVAVRAVRTRPHPAEVHWRRGRYVQLLAVQGANHRVRASVSDRDHQVPLQGLMANYTGTTSLTQLERCGGWFDGVRTMLYRTHHRVSVRWLRRYVAAWAWLQGQEEPAKAIIGALMRAPPSDWRVVRIAPLLQGLTR